MPLHKNMLFSTTMKSATGVSLWKNEATAHSHAQWTKSVQWCLVDQARFCVSSFLHQVHHDLVVFLWCFFLSFCLQNFEKSQFLTLPPSNNSWVVWAAALGQFITQCLALRQMSAFCPIAGSDKNCTQTDSFCTVHVLWIDFSQKTFLPTKNCHHHHELQSGPSNVDH